MTVVCRPSPVESDNERVARSDSGANRFVSVDLPTPDWPTSMALWLASSSRTGATVSSFFAETRSTG